MSNTAAFAARIREKHCEVGAANSRLVSQNDALVHESREYAKRCEQLELDNSRLEHDMHCLRSRLPTDAVSSVHPAAFYTARAEREALMNPPVESYKLTAGEKSSLQMFHTWQLQQLARQALYAGSTTATPDTISSESTTSVPTDSASSSAGAHETSVSPPQGAWTAK